MTKKKAVVILSGGMDSVTTLAIAKDKNFDCYNFLIAKLAYKILAYTFEFKN